MPIALDHLEIDVARQWWIAQDGRVYSAASGANATTDDPDFLAWIEAGGTATIWPCDATGAQTQAALDEVLAYYGLGPAVIADVSSAQAKIALLRAGHLDAVKDAVAAAGGEVAIWYAEARTWQRGNPYVAAIGEAVGLSASEIDALFRQAAGIAAP